MGENISFDEAAGGACHEGAQDGKHSVAFHKCDGEFRSLDAKDGYVTCEQSCEKHVYAGK